MREKKVSKTIAKGVVALLDVVLRVEANSTSCGLVYQPKAPERLKEFRNLK